VDSGLIPRGRAGDALLALAVVALPLAAAFGGSRSGRPVILNLGPGDAPYVSGFAPSYEIDDRIATHWTTYHAAIRLPLAVEGDGVVVYRYARVFPQSAVVEVRVADALRDRFEGRGGLFVERRTTLGAPLLAPLEIRFDIDSHERRDLGLKLDWVRVEPSPSGRVRLTGAGRWAPALVVALVVALLVGVGFGLGTAAALASPVALALALLLRADPWLALRLLRGVPMALMVFGLPAAAASRWLVARGRAQAASLRTLALLGLCAFLSRTAAVNHPDFYYPDLRTHETLSETVQKAGLDFLRAPATYIRLHGLWIVNAHGRTYAFPYVPTFHIPFAILALPYDQRILAMKLAGVLTTLLPLPAAWLIARRLGISPIGVVLLLFVPTYTSRLSFAFLPSLLGHAMDMALLAWLAGHAERLHRPLVWTAGAVLVAACQLTYISSVMNVCVFVAVFALTAPRREGDSAQRAALRVLAMGLFGSALAVAVYYRDFLDMLVDVAGRIAGTTAGGGSVYPVQSFFSVAWERTHSFFDGIYPLLAAAGFWLLRRQASARRLLLAWTGAYVLLLFGRAKVPDLFTHGHETLFATPLFCLLAGEALGALWRRGAWGRATAMGLAAILAVQGFMSQWRFVADQLGNAR
jgi:hypothetical protein